MTPKTFALALLFVPGLMSAADLSRYRTYQLGADVATIAKQTGVNPAAVRLIQQRPAVIQELEWRPQTFGTPSEGDAAKQVVFSFYDGALFRIAIDYDHYAVEGLTDADMVEALSATYGTGVTLAAIAKEPSPTAGEQEEIVAQWQDSQYSFQLLRSSYGRGYKLVGSSTALAARAQTSILEAAQLDKDDAPQREAARAAKDEETERARLEKARLANKPKFKP